ncbi:MAG TPA: dihydroorotate dehydrogenase (quinone), partial [Pseudomonadales bacterium]|nr:dihydroorotate dehydrogenase (quinone) [Pseudomonadales bacterium]
KNGDYFKGLAALGFGFVEIGTITPRPQPGNPQPRLFRLPNHQAIINRMGFNNLGVEHLVRQVEHAKFDGVLGINIGKNFDTAVENAVQDYLHCLKRVYPLASYVVVNISSPNTPGLRTLQIGDSLRQLLAPLKEAQDQLASQHGRYVPLVVKIAPDLEPEETQAMADQFLQLKIDGVIATNTTLARPGLENEPLAKEAGGLSGRPCRERATATLRTLCKALDGRIPVIGVGGITDGAGAVEKFQSGAKLIQLYTGFIYQGPCLIRECITAVERAGLITQNEKTIR